MHTDFAPKPPLGWNSYDCFGSDVNETEIRENAAFMAEHMKDAGWEYVVVDFCWSHPSPGACANPHIGKGMQPLLHTDLHGRLVPAPNRFPSSVGGAGFKPLADYVHGLGLKFGIHLMRGIPKQVTGDYFQIEGSEYTTHDVGTGLIECEWLDHMETVNTAHPAGQDYYDSCFRLYAEWGVDYVKVDDILADGSPRGMGPYHGSEVEAIRTAIDRCGRPIVLSLSPGDAPIAATEHLRNNANLWRMSADFWDDWQKLKRMFSLCAKWWKFRFPGAWPDADMLPLGRICKRGPKMPERDSKFTPDEARTMLTLWCVFRSPLMMGGHLPETDEATINLLTNAEVLEVNQDCVGGKPLAGADPEQPVWISEYPNRGDKVIALFNLRDAAAEVTVPLASLGISSGARVRDLWSGEDQDALTGITLSRKLPAHGSVLLRVTRS